MYATVVQFPVIQKLWDRIPFKNKNVPSIVLKRNIRKYIDSCLERSDFGNKCYFHIIFGKNKMDILGLAVVYSYDNISHTILEIQSYEKGIGEKLLKDFMDTKYPQVYFKKNTSYGSKLTRYYNKLAKKYNWKHIKEKVNGKTEHTYCIINLPINT